MSTNMSPEGQPDRESGSSSAADGSSVPDEQWAELVRQAESAGSDAPKEPSARARMVTARLRALDEEAAAAQGAGRRWGRKPKKVEPWQPEGWRTGPAWQEMNGRPRKRRRLAGTLGFIAVLGLLVVAMRPSLLTDHLPGGGISPDTDTTRLLSETAAPTAAPAREAPDRPTLDEPFRGSPALRWADGAQGIELPAAKATGGMSKDEVADALSKTRRLLVESNLDPAVLRGERPRALLQLLDPHADGAREQLEKSLSEPSEKNDPAMLLSRFDPAEARVLGDVVKVRGRMTFKAGEPGSVEVDADYSFVYALRKTGGDDVARTIVRRRLTTVLYDPERWDATRGKLALTSYESNVGNTECDVYDGFLHPWFSGEDHGTPPGDELIDPYDRSEWPDQKECGTVTRT
ncbi:hypothetical protein [Streptomyces sp. NPDC053728]|uniref:hypothetical protein n=1 Tax=Streptomyces sp. NPDC053728 TaxID=3155534 RepID=UPI00343A0C81